MAEEAEEGLFPVIIIVRSSFVRAVEVVADEPSLVIVRSFETRSSGSD